MPIRHANALLDVPVYPAGRYAPLADRIGRLLSSTGDVIFVQAEAILALEAVATSIARPGVTAVNIVTSPYGAYFGAWLRRAGATVHELLAEPGQPAGMQALRARMDALPAVDVVAAVHAEAANGVLNPLADIAALAKARNALLVIDAVASIGAHPLDVDALGIDIAVIGAQKGLAGPAGVSAVAMSQRAWTHVAATPDFAPSSLSLAEIRRTWLDRGRGALPGMPAPLEFWALEAAIDRVEAEGIDNVIARHQRAAMAARAGLRALGVEPWIADDRAASALVTSAPVPDGIDAQALIDAAARYGVALGAGFGNTEGRLVRLDHTGAKAAFDSVLAAVVGYGAALGTFGTLGMAVDIGAAAKAVATAWAAPRAGD
ncbi:aspartate aminotransferase-like enzyme [Paraburkholderia sp. BL8N3]|jgi:aspartate aminotransferase-like enzyme|nr:aminotransferase class V-fold PLP-dependent enzyme [Paraburkholderia sp. BL8N3]TCK34894.1 aspartate aminotransferase-like enzyme [Paraburkholderia sp. BL8N3]